MSDFVFSMKPDVTKPETELVVTHEQVSWGKETFLLKDIVGLRYGHRKATLQTGPSYYFVLKDRLGKELNVTFKSITTTSQRAQEAYAAIEAAFLKAYGESVIAGFHQKLKANGEIKIGPLILHKKGLSFDEKTFFKTQRHNIPWEQIGFGPHPTDGAISVGDRRNPKIIIAFDLFGEFNGQYLIKYIDRVKNDPALRAQIR